MRSHSKYWTTLFTKLGFYRKKQRPQSTNHYCRKLRYEQCEDRRMLAVITVNNPGDFIDADPDITTLREAIVSANANPDADEIYFASSLDGTSIVLTEGELSIECAGYPPYEHAARASGS